MNRESEQMRLFALRGAVMCNNDENDIIRRTAELYDELLRENCLKEENIVSLIFSVTADLDALNPAAALRRTGRARELALFAVQEAACRESLPRTIRALVHCYLPAGPPPATYTVMAPKYYALIGQTAYNEQPHYRSVYNHYLTDNYCSFLADISSSKCA